LNEEQLFQIRMENIRKRFLKYTRKAFLMLPRLDKPRILDIGCGSGIPTLELARLSQGEVMGIDIDQPALDKFTGKIKEAGLVPRVQAVHCSIFDMDFPDASFDIIWSEGSIYAIGFERGLREWKHLLKPGGFIVVHDEQGNVREKLVQISDCGYELLGSFLLSEDTWRNEYFIPLEKLVNGTRAKHTENPEVLEALNRAQDEINMFKDNPERNSSAFFVMKRN
jgi:SAM-dependent methyltransferase